ncbi:MAG: type II secretion system minor pseudopilin GspI [bacterium]
MRDRKRQTGFTLIEVMVAIIIMATVLSVSLVLIGQQTRTAISVEDQGLATILAENVLAETMMRSIPPEIAATRDEVVMGRGTFIWERSVVAGEAILQIQVTVYKKGQPQQLAMMTAFRRLQ